MELAYACREAPRVIVGTVELSDEGSKLRLDAGRSRVRIALHDNYFAEPLAALVQSSASEGESLRLEVWGVLMPRSQGGDGKG